MIRSPGLKRVEPKPCKGFKIDKIEFDANSDMILDVFPPVFWSKIRCIATSHSSGVMVNTNFPVMKEMIWGFPGKPEFVYQSCVKLIGHGGAHKYSRALKSLPIQNTCSITNFLPTSLTTCFKSKIKNMFKVK